MARRGESAPRFPRSAANGMIAPRQQSGNKYGIGRIAPYVSSIMRTKGESGERRWYPVRTTGFTLIELLVVVGILILLLAMLFPSLSAARESARRVVCAANLKNWGIASVAYRNDYNDFIPTEGTFLDDGLNRPGTWYNELPTYLDLPAYKDLPGANEEIEALPDMHVWICPSKNLTRAFKSQTGKNQFHYGWNLVLDGIGAPPEGSDDAPGFPDQGEAPLRATRFAKHPTTVLMFDIAPNSMAGTPRYVANKHWRDFQGRRLGKFHGDYANFLYLDGGVAHFRAADIVTDNDFQNGQIIWHRSGLYWGYVPSAD